MNRQKQKEKVFDLLFNSIKTFLKLDFYYITFDFNVEEGEDYTAHLESCDYTHFTANISIKNKVWEYLSDENKIDGIILLIIHEMCHIFTSMGSNVFLNERDELNRFIGDYIVVSLNNKMTGVEEQMTNILDKVLFDSFKKTKEYKEIIKLVKLIK